MRTSIRISHPLLFEALPFRGTRSLSRLIFRSSSKAPARTALKLTTFLYSNSWFRISEQFLSFIPLKFGSIPAGSKVLRISSNRLPSGQRQIYLPPGVTLSVGRAFESARNFAICSYIRFICVSIFYSEWIISFERILSVPISESETSFQTLGQIRIHQIFSVSGNIYWVVNLFWRCQLK